MSLYPLEELDSIRLDMSSLNMKTLNMTQLDNQPTQPIFQFLLRWGPNGGSPNYNGEDGVSQGSSPMTTSLLKIYKKYAKLTDILLLFNNPAGTTNNRLPPVVTTVFPGGSIVLGCSFNSYLDAQTASPDLFSKSYQWASWDYEKPNTPFDQLDQGMSGCSVANSNGAGVLQIDKGNTTYTATNGTWALGSVYAVKITGLTPGDLINSIALDINTSAGNIRVGIYADDAGSNGGTAGNPFTLLGSGVSTASPGTGKRYFNITTNTPNGIPTLVKVPASGNVWVAFKNDTSTLSLVETTGLASGTLLSFAQTFAGGWTNFPTSPTNGTIGFHAWIANNAYSYGDANTQISALNTTVRANSLKFKMDPPRIDNGNMTQNAYKIMGKYCDLVVWQGQQLVNTPSTLLTNAKAAIPILKTNKPNLKVLLELSSVVSTLAQMKAGWDAVKGQHLFDGIIVFNSATGGTLATEQTIMDGIYDYVGKNFP